MPRTSLFSFNKDFRAADVHEDTSVSQAQHEADMASAEARGFARGEQEGRQAAVAMETARMAQAVERLGLALGQALHAMELRLHDAERQALDLALAFALKLAGHALSNYPYAALEDAARACFTEARQAPHVAVRVNDGQVEGIKQRLTAIALERGFAGKLVVLGDPEIPLGDGRLEWADGGFIHDRGATEQLIARAIENYLGALETAPDHHGESIEK